MGTLHVLITIVLLATGTSLLAMGPEFGGGSSPACSQLPPSLTLANQTYVLPDPFRFIDNSSVKSLADWDCRAAQVRSLFQEYELGWKPPRPPVLSAVFESNTLNITAGTAGKTIQFSVPISYPNVTTGLGPYPAIIAFDSLSIPRPDSVAVITLKVAQIGQQTNQSSRGVGAFFDLYGQNSSAGAMMAWAWATSRIIDALELTPSARIDPARIAVTGCSRNGKGAMVAGAFDERIALTIPQESGSGGDACWRVSRAMLANEGLATQTAWEIVRENVWFSPSFAPFAADNYSVGLLPVDHHQLAGLVAPRGLYSTSNVGFLWLGDQSSYECMRAASTIFQALGVADRQGFSQDGPHAHCSFPDDQVGEINAFYDKFLFEREANTSVMRTVGNWTFDPSWVPWTAPTRLV